MLYSDGGKGDPQRSLCYIGEAFEPVYTTKIFREG